MSLQKMKSPTSTELHGALSSKSPIIEPDLANGKKLPRWKLKSPRLAGVRSKRDECSTSRRRRPETPLLKCKLKEEHDNSLTMETDNSPESRRKNRNSKNSSMPRASARKLAAGLWRLQSTELQGVRDNNSEMKNENHARFQTSANHVPCKNDFDHIAISASPEISNSAMEAITKWHPLQGKKNVQQDRDTFSLVHQLQADLKHSHARITHLESERRSLKKKLECFMHKISEERASWRRREHEKIRAVIDDAKAELHREKKSRRRIELLNSKLVNDLADAKLSAKRFIQEYEKERKARELIEEVCDELAKEIGEDKAEIEELKSESLTFKEEVDEERKMLQMAEVWREERVQMKLIDAKIALEEKYSEMKKLIAEMEQFTKSRELKEDEEAKLLVQAVEAVNIEDMNRFAYEPPNPDDLLSIFESNERENTCDAARVSSCRRPIGEETGSDQDQGSSSHTFNKIYGSSNASISEIESEENASATEISEICSLPRKEMKKSSISKLWKLYPTGGRFSNGGRPSNASAPSPDRGSAKGISSPYIEDQSYSPEGLSIGRVMKSFIEWPRGVHKNSLKTKLMEARIENQKIQLRQALKHKI